MSTVRVNAERPYSVAIDYGSLCRLPGLVGQATRVAVIYGEPLAEAALAVSQLVGSEKVAVLSIGVPAGEAAKTPEERAAIAQQIRDLSGKQEPQNRFTVVPGGQEWDAASGAMRNVPARVVNNQTGQFVDGERQAGAQPQAMPTDRPKLAAGQIYQTARGPARWDGNQFVGV